MSGPSITWAAEADFDRDDVYETDITSLITMPGQGIAIERGFDGSGNYLISKVSLDVNNNDGAFSQDNLSSARAGQLTPGVPLKLTATVSATPYSAWTGYIQKFQESGIGAGTVSMCRLDCTDLFTYLAESDLINITVSTSRDTDAALIAVMDAMGLTSGDRNFDDGLQDFPYHYALAQTALQAMLEAVKSEMGGRLFCNADGQLRFKARNAQLGTSVAATFGDVTGHYPVSISKATTNDEYVTAVRVRGTVFREGQADVEVFRFSRGMLNDTPDSLAIAAGDTYQRDFDTQSAVVAITAPVSSVDYLGNSAVDGSGTDKTSALTVTVTDRGAGRFNLKIKNTDASTVYVTLFRLRGQPTNFFADRPEAYFSLSVPGRKAGKVIELDVPYAGDTGQKLRDYAYTVLRTYRYAYSRLTLTFRPADDTEAARLLGLELGDRVAFRDTSLTSNGSYSDDIYYIETIRLVAPANMVGNFTMALELVPSYLSRNLDALVFDLFDRADFQNYCTNGGLETNTTGWSAGGGASISRDTGTKRTGLASLKVVAGAQFDSAIFAATVPASSAVTFSCWVYSANPVNVFLDLSDGIDQDLNGVNFTCPAGEWTYVYHSGTTDSHTSRNFHVYLNQVAGETFYIDDVEIRVGDLGTATSGAVWANDSGFDIASNKARANTDTLSIADLELSPNAILTDPGIETGVTEWGYYQATLSRSSAQAHAGTYSLKVLNAGAFTVYNAFRSYSISGSTAGRRFSGGAWVYGEGSSIGQTLTLIIRETGGANPSFGDTTATVTLSAGWQWVEASRVIVEDDRTAIQLVIERSSGAVSGEYFYADDAKFFEGSFADDQVWEVQLAAIGAGDEVGLTCRKTDANNYYRAYVDKGSNEVILEKVVAAVVTELSSPAYTVGTTGEIKLMVQGSRLRVWVDRRLYIDTTDSSLTTGTKGGLMARNAAGTTTFANVYGQGL